jgi:hypothetical protein
MKLKHRADYGMGLVTTTGKKEYTPDPKTDWGPNERFAFGSNKGGQHFGGAARYAADKLGAEWGVGEGPTGQCYAVPTLVDPNTLTDADKRAANRVTQEELTESLRKLSEYAVAHPEEKIYLSKIGLGIGGWTLPEVHKAFWDAGIPFNAPNVIYPIEFEMPDDAD